MLFSEFPPGKEDFESQNRKKPFSRIATAGTRISPVESDSIRISLFRVG